MVSNSKAKIEVEISTSGLKKDIQNFSKLTQNEQERLRVKDLSKGAKQKRNEVLKDLKMRQKYELQFSRQGLKRKEAQKKAALRVEMKEADRLRADHEDRMSQKKKGRGGGVFAGSALGSFAGTMMAGVTKGATDMISGAFEKLETAEKRQFFAQKHGGGAMGSVRSSAVKTGESVDTLLESFDELSHVVGKNKASGLMGKLTALSSPLYSFKEVMADVGGFLKGGGVDEMGNFAGAMGKGKARQMNMLLQQQQMMIDAGLSYSMADDSLIKERESLVKGLKSKEGYRASQEVQLKRGAKEGYENLGISTAEKVVSPLVAGMGKGMTGEQLAGLDLSAGSAKVAMNAFTGVVDQAVGAMKNFVSSFSKKDRQFAAR